MGSSRHRCGLRARESSPRGFPHPQSGGDGFYRGPQWGGENHSAPDHQRPHEAEFRTYPLRRQGNSRAARGKAGPPGHSFRSPGQESVQQPDGPGEHRARLYATGENLGQAIQRLTRLYPKFQDSLGRNAGGLSGGQREILLIGRALVGNPRLLLIDEPTEGLAAIVIEDIFRILKEMKQEKMLTFIVEQNLSVVSRLADRIYIMKEGKIIKEMTDPSEIRNTAELESYL